MSSRPKTQSRIETHNNISFTVHLFREGGVYIAYVTEFDLSSCGDTTEEARRNIKDAVVWFLAVSEKMGTLNEILEESGYQKHGSSWLPPEFVSLDKFSVNFPV
mgnify:CR=1 FL=1